MSFKLLCCNLKFRIVQIRAIFDHFHLPIQKIHNAYTSLHFHSRESCLWTWQASTYKNDEINPLDPKFHLLFSLHSTHCGGKVQFRKKICTKWVNHARFDTINPWCGVCNHEYHPLFAHPRLSQSHSAYVLAYSTFVYTIIHIYVYIYLPCSLSPNLSNLVTSAAAASSRPSLSFTHIAWLLSAAALAASVASMVATAVATATAKSFTSSTSTEEPFAATHSIKPRNHQLLLQAVEAVASSSSQHHILNHELQQFHLLEHSQPTASRAANICR